MKNNELIFARKNKDVILPTKRQADAGYDIYAYFAEDEISFEPHETKLIATGLYTAMSDDFVLVLKERGSTGSIGMKVGAGIVDSNYRGEIFVAITNENNKPMIISKLFNTTVKHSTIIVYPYSKAIAQALILPVPKMTTKEVSIEQLQNIQSDRGTGCIGSSGK